MEDKISVIGIIVENKKKIPEINRILSLYGDYIIGRIGIPHYKEKINIISIVIDAKKDISKKLCGEINELSGVHLL